MKKFISILALIAIFGIIQAQAPQKFTYQSVVRNSSGALMSNAPVGLRFSVLQGSTTGSSVYVETHSTTTNANGLATVQIGGGTAVSGSFSTISWANGPYFIKTEVDPTGGTVYSLSNVTQLLSVPYALYAENSGTPGPQGATGPQGPQGAAGLTGPIGPAGPQGLQGPQGIAGDSGATGPIGPIGPQGLQGPPGLPGNTGPVGPQGLQGPQGMPGDSGAIGPTGAMGPQGPAGPTGANGIDGSAGNGLALQLNCSVVAPSDNTAYLMGSINSTTGAPRRVLIPKTGTIKACYVYIVTAGCGATFEPSSLYLNVNSLDVLIGNNLVNSCSLQPTISNAALNYSVTAGDYLLLKWHTPIWATNPTGTIEFNAVVYIE